MLTVGSLFAGIGGFDLGLERAGMKILWQVEIDEYCRRVLAKHWPDVQRYGDIRECGKSNLAPVDVLCGGFPCQPFSSASRGRKRGMSDTRFLWPEMLRVIDELQPTWVIGENVNQLDGPALEQVVAQMEALGYEVAPPLEVPACAFGYDHWRARIWILGYSDRNRQSSRAVNAETPQLSRNSSESRDVGATDGLSRKLDSYRLAALGNAVIPDIPEWIGKQIISAENAR